MKNKQIRKQFLNDNWNIQTLKFRWGTSKGRDTWGYTICTLIDTHGNRLAQTIGGGYDMKGTCIGELINKYFGEELKKLVANSGSMDTPSGLYGLTHYNPKAKSRKRMYLKRANKHTQSYVNGACGMSSMRRILNKIGFELTYLTNDTYELNVR